MRGIRDFRQLDPLSSRIAAPIIPDPAHSPDPDSSPASSPAPAESSPAPALHRQLTAGSSPAPALNRQPGAGSLPAHSPMTQAASEG